MDYSEIANAIVQFIALGVAGGTLKEVGKEIYDKTKDLLKGDELVVLNLLEENSESKDFQEVVANKLATRLEENPVIAKQLEELLKQIPSIQTKQNTISQSGTGNISNQDISNSTINFNK